MPKKFKHIGHKEEDDKIYSFLAYISILWIVALASKKNDKFTMFHVKQGIVLTIFEVALWIVLAILDKILFFAHFLSNLIAAFGWIFVLVCIIFGILAVLREEQKELPFIGKFAEYFNF